jgi:anti-sigma B factor antagonist
MPTGRTQTPLYEITADPALTLRVETGAAGTVLHVAGELDMATTGQLSCCVDQLLTARPRGKLVLDLSALRFAAVDGVRTLLRIRDAAHQSGGRLVLRDPSPRVVRVLAITEALGSFDVEPRIDDEPACEGSPESDDQH